MDGIGRGQRASAGTNLYRLKVGDEFELGNSGQIQLRVAGNQLVQPRVQRLLEHQHLPVARVLHQPLHEVCHLQYHKFNPYSSCVKSVSKPT